MDFSKVTFDDDVDELEAEEARELISQFKTAQEQNIAEFQNASDKIDDLEGSFSEFEDADEQLTADVAEATFMSEDEAAELTFARKRQVLADFSEKSEEAGDEGGEDGGDADFSDMGQHGETHTDDDDHSFAEEHLGGIEGLN